MNKKMYLVAIILGLLTCISCVSKKKLTYMQGAEEFNNMPQKITQNYELRIQPDDQLYIVVSGQEPELLEIFSNNKLLGTTGNVSSVDEIAGLRVDKEGMVQIPLIGKLQAEGLTRNQLADEIKRKLEEKEYIKNPTVAVQIKGFKVSVMGEVNSPGVKDISGDRITILEALSLAGDLTPSAKRNNIMILRESNDERVTYSVDLTSAESVLNSPCYYLSQNDVIYVEPNNSIKVKGSPTAAFLGVGGTILSVVASVISLVVVLTK